MANKVLIDNFMFSLVLIDPLDLYDQVSNPRKRRRIREDSLLTDNVIDLTVPSSPIPTLPLSPIPTVPLSSIQTLSSSPISTLPSSPIPTLPEESTVLVSKKKTTTSVYIIMLSLSFKNTE